MESSTHYELNRPHNLPARAALRGVELVVHGSANRQRDYRRYVSLAAVLLLHTGAIYAVAQEPAVVPPKLSIPITVSLVSAEVPALPPPTPKAPPKPKQVTKPIPKKIEASAPILEPKAPPPPSEQPPQAEVVPPRYDPVHLGNPKMRYPKLCERLGQEGRVVLKVYVTPAGSAREVHVQASSGFPCLDDAARKAAEGWRYEPARQHGQAVGVWFPFVINFSLSQG
jgi:periplasmic protein TonB